MSVMLPKEADLLGVPLLKVRNLLQAWHQSGRFRNIGQISRKRGIELPRATTAVLVEELRDRGFIGDVAGDFVIPVVDGLTAKGRALGSAKATARTQKEKALRVFDGLLEAAERINARGDLPFRVREIWLFGSMVDPDRADVGDIDFCLEFDRPPAFDDWDEAMERYRALARELDAPYSADAYTWVKERMLYGARRHQLLAPNDVDHLVRMGNPCRLAFDDRRGGRVDDAVLARHPGSSGRDPSMPEPSRMPDMAAPSGSFGPVHIELLIPMDLDTKGFADSFPSWTNSWPAVRANHRYFGRPPEIVSDPASEDVKFLPEDIDPSRCDGRAAFAMVVLPPNSLRDDDGSAAPRCALVVGRSIDVGQDGFVYRLNIEQFSDGGREPTEDMLIMARWVLNACMQADIERIALRSREAEVRFDLKVELDAVASVPATTSLLIDLDDDVLELVRTVSARLGIDPADVEPDLDVAAAPAAPA
ncbi:nucleotidyltransferase domain-containing protein [Methylobacterium sp. 092160098-2]|uniref:nucleotidyltransferase domain-containing protein n=1 Tax=Methylobacterium sp. 092160098-2 TaxID=3025129 RepID=UPI002381B698|nr:nucleotidyltransferase domain-containing protein [Methylobacterium sp. 092160098-2]MDE4914518.1 nucleotidyltransferase domain-containing protein [Methylobacterium sp. 092160098-2]